MSSKLLQCEAVLEKIQEVDEGLRKFTFKFPDGQVMEFKPGQHVQLVHQKDGKPYFRPYSIASPPSVKDRVELYINIVPGGFMTTHLFGMREGQTIRLRGPLGLYTLREPLERPIVFMSTGTGIAPFRAMAHHLLKDRKTDLPLLMFDGVRYAKQLAYREEFEALARAHENFRYVPCVTRPPEDWPYPPGRIQVVAEQVIRKWDDKVYYVCGVTSTVLSIRDFLVSKGVSEKDVLFEKYE